MKHSRTDKEITKHLNAALGLAINQAVTATLYAERGRINTMIASLDDRSGVLVKEDVVAIIDNTISVTEGEQV